MKTDILISEAPTSLPPFSEAYRTPEAINEPFRWRDMPGSDSAMFEYADRVGKRVDLSSQEALHASLDHLSFGEEADDMARVLGTMPVRFLVNVYGERAAMWVVANGDPADRQGRVREGMAALGYDENFLEKAEGLTLREPGELRSATDVQRQYHFMQDFVTTDLSGIDLEQLAYKTAWPDFTVSEKRAKAFSLVPLQVLPNSFGVDGYVQPWPYKDEIENEHLKYHIWMDTPVGVMLTHKHIPQMVIGLCLKGPDQLLISQLQKVGGKRFNEDDSFKNKRWPRGIDPVLDWQSLGIQVTGHIADVMGLGSVGMIEGHKTRGVNCHLTGEQATQLYDDTAQRLGFCRQPDGDWQKPTSEILSSQSAT